MIKLSPVAMSAQSWLAVDAATGLRKNIECHRCVQFRHWQWQVDKCGDFGGAYRCLTGLAVPDQLGYIRFCGTVKQCAGIITGQLPDTAAVVTHGISSNYSVRVPEVSYGTINRGSFVSMCVEQNSSRQSRDSY